MSLGLSAGPLAAMLHPPLLFYDAGVKGAACDEATRTWPIGKRYWDGPASP